jgi:hypothetical protein
MLLKKKKTFSDSLNISTDISQSSSYIRHTSKTSFPIKKETKFFNIDNSFHKNVFFKNSLNQIERKQKKKVKFIDEIFNIPLANITLIQSFKKFNSGNNYINKYENQNENEISRKLSCCIVF